MEDFKSPVVIGGKGGSGTRVFVDIVEKLGYYKGPTNTYNDVVLWSDFIHHHQVEYINNWWKTEAPASNKHTEMTKEFLPYYKKYIKNMPKTKHCVFKNPQGIHILPFYDEFFSYRCKFIHCIRDGRDMICSKNLNEFKQAEGKEIFEDQGSNFYEKAIKFWENVNLLVYNYGIQTMQDRYVSIKFENLCNKTELVVEKIANFLGVSLTESLLEECKKVVNTPNTIGRWKKQKNIDMGHIEKIGYKGLSTFKYL